MIHIRPICVEMTHQKPSLELLYKFMMQSIICMLVLLSSTISMFIPNIFICIIFIVVICHIYQSFLLHRGTSYNHLLSVQLTLSFTTQISVIPAPVFFKWNHNLYLYLQFVRCIFSIKYLLSHTQCYFCLF